MYQTVLSKAILEFLKTVESATIQEVMDYVVTHGATKCKATTEEGKPNQNLYVTVNSALVNMKKNGMINIEGKRNRKFAYIDLPATQPDTVA